MKALLLTFLAFTFFSGFAGAQGDPRTRRPARPAAAPAKPAAAGNALEAEVGRRAEALKPRLVEMRRDFHMHPELSNREERTSRVIAERLKQLGYTDIRTGVARYGVIATLKGGKPGPVVAVRADIDALPIEESIEVPYKSRNRGVKHACGHDVHTSVGLGLAEIFMDLREQLPGTVKFIFQPAEEGPPEGEEGGARLMVKEGALENPRPQAIFGLHVMPMYPVGQVAVTPGPAMATADRFRLTIRGKGVHAAYPHDGVDPIVVAAEAVQSLQSIRSRKVNTLEPMVLSVGSIHGGTRFNIIPNEVVMTGTIRTLNNEVREQVHREMRRVLEGVTAGHGAAYELKIEEMTALTFNEPALVEETLPALRRAVGADNVMARAPQMGAEDFSYFQQAVPGHYFFLGVSNKQKGIGAMIHTAEFDVDEDSLVVGVKALGTMVIDYLARHAK